MMLCRSCGRISTGDPKFCEGCGKSFNSTICPAKHESSAGASHCATCGSTELSTPTRGVCLSAPNRLLAVTIGLVLLRLITPLLPSLMDSLIQIISWVFAFAIAPILCLFIQIALPFLVLWVVVGIFIQILSGERINIYKIYVAASKNGIDLLIAGLKISVDALLSFIVKRRRRE